jgi:hypothetical protein
MNRVQDTTTDVNEIKCREFYSQFRWCNFGDGNATANVGFEDACCVQSGNVQNTYTSVVK